MEGWAGRRKAEWHKEEPVMEILNIKTNEHNQFLDITSQIRQVVDLSGVQNGRADVFIPHTTAAVTINEGADPNVVRDIIKDLQRLVPEREKYYQHLEGNSASHMKSSLIGCHHTILIDNGRLALGTWQAIFFCEFDGPRSRKAFIEVTES